MTDRKQHTESLLLNASWHTWLLKMFSKNTKLPILEWGSLELRRQREGTSLALLLVTVLRQPGGEDSRRKGWWAPPRTRSHSSFFGSPEQLFHENHLDDMCPVHMPQICCPAALFPVVQALYESSTGIWVKQEPKQVSLEVLLTLRTWHWFRASLRTR